jgi:hypothetical protein
LVDSLIISLEEIILGGFQRFLNYNYESCNCAQDDKEGAEQAPIILRKAKPPSCTRLQVTESASNRHSARNEVESQNPGCSEMADSLLVPVPHGSCDCAQDDKEGATTTPVILRGTKWSRRIQAVQKWLTRYWCQCRMDPATARRMTKKGAEQAPSFCTKQSHHPARGCKPQNPPLPSFCAEQRRHPARGCRTQNPSQRPNRLKHSFYMA